MCIKDRNSSNTVWHHISSINPSYLGTNKCVCTHLFVIVITMILEIRIVYSISPVIFWGSISSDRSSLRNDAPILVCISCSNRFLNLYSPMSFDMLFQCLNFASRDSFGENETEAFEGVPAKLDLQINQVWLSLSKSKSKILSLNSWWRLTP